MTVFDKELVADFIVEANEHLEEVDRQLLLLESNSLGLEGIDDIFRSVHSIKGVASFLGIAPVGRLSHHLESVLNILRKGETEIKSEYIAPLFTPFDLLKAITNDLDNLQRYNVDGPCETLIELEKRLLEQTASDRTKNAKPAPDKPTTSISNDSVKPSAASDVSTKSEALPSVSPDPHDTTNSSDGDKPSATTMVDAVKSETGVRAVAPESTIRVSVSILDMLMNLTGELVLARNQLSQSIQARTWSDLPSLGTKIDQVTSDLQDAVMRSRMQPVGTALNRLPRMVRDLCNKLNRECVVEIEGGEVELDKTLLEKLYDPLTHLIRNAVDHGIEPPTEREQRRKPRAGRLHIRAFHQAGRVHLILADDGRGIDAERVKAKAVSKGLMREEDARRLSDREAIMLIFQPGFSTAEAVTEVSGRGMGMDVVKKNIESLGGTVEVVSQVNQGTTIAITLPLTLAIMPALIVQAGKERFALAESSTVELVRLTPGEARKRIDRLNRHEALRFRGALLPLLRLSEVMGCPERASSRQKCQRQCAETRRGRAETSDSLNIVVVEAVDFRYGIIVDAMLDPEQIVVKPLGEHFREARSLAGATVLGDGRVAFILDVCGLAEHARLQTAHARFEEIKDTPRFKSDQQTILLLRNDPGEIFAVPMAMVARIERIRSGQIQTVGKDLMLQYRGGALPVLQLDGCGLSHAEQDLYLLVFVADGREIGLLVPHLLDITDTLAEITPCQSSLRYVSGTMVIEDQIARMIDLYELAAMNRCVNHDVKATKHVSATQGRTILVAEDSAFFRTQLSRFLESQGHKLILCGDGQEAWEQLQLIGSRVDLVLTDVEMPRLNGFDLCRRIRATTNLRHLPVIALTSLADSKAQSLGREAGVNAYQIKMDRNRLLEAVNQLLNPSHDSLGQQELAHV